MCWHLLYCARRRFVSEEVSSSISSNVDPPYLTSFRSWRSEGMGPKAVKTVRGYAAMCSLCGEFSYYTRK